MEQIQKTSQDLFKSVGDLTASDEVESVRAEGVVLDEEALNRGLGCVR